MEEKDVPCSWLQITAILRIWGTFSLCHGWLINSSPLSEVVLPTFNQRKVRELGWDTGVVRSQTLSRGSQDPGSSSLDQQKVSPGGGGVRGNVTPSFKISYKGWWDGSVGRGTCHQAWPEFNPMTHRRREPTSLSCPLISVHAHYDTYMPTHVHTTWIKYF